MVLRRLNEGLVVQDQEKGRPLKTLSEAIRKDMLK